MKLVQLLIVTILVAAGPAYGQTSPPTKLSDLLDKINANKEVTASLVREANPALNVPDALPESFYAKNKKEILGGLTHHRLEYKAYSTDTSGNISYLQSLVSASKQTIVVRSEQTSYKFVTVDGVKKKYGFVIGIEAEFTSKTANVDLGSLFAIGVAAKAKSISGTLAIRVEGLSGEPIQSGLPTSSSGISEESLQKAMETVATIKAKVYDPNVTVTPVLID